MILTHGSWLPVEAVKKVESTKQEGGAVERLVVELSANIEPYKEALAEVVRATSEAAEKVADTKFNVGAPDTDGDHVTVQISGHPVAVADFLAVIR